MAISKKSLIVLAVVAVIVIAAITAVMSGGGKRGSTIAGDNAKDVDNTDDVETRDQIANVTLEGTSDKVTDRFPLQAGVTIFHLNYTGTSNFAVTLMDANDQFVDLLANEVGAYTGETLIGVKTGNLVGADPGDHYLEVDASGPWSVTIEQPRVTSGSGLPLTVTGNGAQASMPIDLTSGEVMFNMTNSGSGNFAVTLWADDGEHVNLLANEIGDFSGEGSVTVNGGTLNASPGIHWLDVDTDGSWTIRITTR